MGMGMDTDGRGCGDVVCYYYCTTSEDIEILYKPFDTS